MGLTNSTNSTAQRVWRFTPADPTSFMPTSTGAFLDSPDMPGNISIPVNMHLYDKTRPCTLLFVGASFRAVPSSSDSSDSPLFDSPLL